MKFTAERIAAIQAQMAVTSPSLTPPDEVVVAVASLVREEDSSALRCEYRSDDSSTTWCVVGLLGHALFDLQATGDRKDWVGASSSAKMEAPHVTLSACFRSLSDLATLKLTSATHFDPLRVAEFDPDLKHETWEVGTAWEVSWRDGSTLALSIGVNPTSAADLATEAIVDKVREVLVAR